MDLRGCSASAVDAVFTFRWRNRPDVSVPVRAPKHNHVIPQLLLATENLTTGRRCLKRVADFLHPPRFQPWLHAACSRHSLHESYAALSAGCQWVVSMLDMARDSILAARTALHSSEQFRLNRFDECSEWLCVEGCTVPPNMHVDIIAHNQRIMLLAWLLQPLASKPAIAESAMYKVGTAPEDAVGMHVMYRGMLHSIASACVAVETDSPLRDDSIAGLQRLLSRNSLAQASAALPCVLWFSLAVSSISLQAGLGVTWCACSQSLLAVANIKRSLVQFNALLVFFPVRFPTLPHPASLSVNPLQPPSSAASVVLPSAAAAAQQPQSNAPHTPLTAASILDADDVYSFTTDGAGSSLGDGSSPVVSDAFLSQLFGEEAQKIFQPFL